jgi:SAM-dependent methyltransferase
MNIEFPSTDDRGIWNLWLAHFWLPTVTAAIEVGIFESLATERASIEELSMRLPLGRRGLAASLPLLAGLDLLRVADGRYHLTDSARLYLLKDSPLFWGPVLIGNSARTPLHGRIVEALRAEDRTTPGTTAGQRPSDGWESGEISPEQARGIAAFMQAHSLPASSGAAARAPLAGVRRLLDVGGGSGCFSIAFAARHPELRCTVMELPAMCDVAREHIERGGAADRVDTRAVDMFREAWPTGYDAIFYANVFHDWNLDTNAELARKAHAALEPGGRILLHEILIDDSGTGPVTAAAFSVLMLFATRGRQYSYVELKKLLEDAGFHDVGVTATYGHYSVVHGYK